MARFPTPDEVEAERERKRQQLRDAGAEPLEDHRKHQPKKRKISIIEEEDGFDDADHVRRWLSGGFTTEALKQQLDRVEMRIMYEMSAKMRDVIEQRELFQAAYRKSYLEEWVDQKD